VGKTGTLTTAKSYGDVELIVDFQFPKKKEKLASWSLVLRKDGDKELKLTLTATDTLRVTSRGAGSRSDSNATLTDESGQWRRLRVSLVEGTLQAFIDGGARVEVRLSGLAKQGPIELQAEKEVELRNLFIHEQKK
jgi:hypothetical protein